MNLKRFLPTLTIVLIISTNSFAQEVLEWRGADRTGVYKETNLLKSWPENGPKLNWEFAELGNGYGSPAITKTNIFINGEIDSISYLYSLDLNGKQLWKAKIGTEWVASYPGSRTTPTVVGDLVYATAGWGKVACFEAASGKLKWEADMVNDFHGRIPRFGFSESVLIEGNNLYCMPGSADTNVVALDRISGKIIWICKGLGQTPSYCSPLLIKLPLRNILVTFSEKAILGIDAKDGKLLWSQKQDGEGDVHINTPWFENGFIYYITGDGNGSVKLKLSDDGTQISEIWRNKAVDNTMGGFVKVNNYIYTSGYEKRYWYIQDANDGKLIDSVKFDRGTTNFADGMLYLYNEKGQMALFKPNGSKIEMVSMFKVTKGTKAHYAHPVINKGVLYIRHGKSLLAYDIKNN